MSDQPRLSWTQPCCSDCWFRTCPNRTPNRLLDPDEETCVYCGSKTRSGIYIRIDPSIAPYPTLRKD